MWFPTLSPCPRRAVLRDATPRSLVLLDEMGKGTKALDGHPNYGNWQMGHAPGTCPCGTAAR